MKNEHLYEWIFHFNSYTNQWNGFLRRYFADYFNGLGGDNILSAPTMGELLKMVKEKER